jgi:uncharacterized protein YyaL (SSP411 family)
MDRTSYADSTVADLINDRFIPIRVDADRRPDISERYSLGGWPTTAFLTADGEVVTGGTYVAAERMGDVLQGILAAFETRSDEIADRLSAHAAHPSEPPGQAASEDALLTSIFDTFDEEHGGFGTEPKFPLCAPLRLALDLCRDSADAAMLSVVTTSLDAMGWGGLYDEVDGGFFRCAATRDWQQPHLEKLLTVNAALALLYLNASEALAASRYRERAQDVLRYIQTWLADPVDGGWWGSQRADAAYYARSHATRSLSAPPVDRVLYAGWNGAMASVALRAAQVLDDPGLAEFAIKSLERVLLACYRPGAGIAHYSDGAPLVFGLLDDQVAMATACLDAYDATGNIVYEMMAEELAHYSLRTMWDDDRGGFFDRAVPDAHDAVGLMRRRLKPYETNCEAAVMLRRLSGTSGDDEFGLKSDATLTAIAPIAAAQGPLAAHYLLGPGDTLTSHHECDSSSCSTEYRHTAPHRLGTVH